MQVPYMSKDTDSPTTPVLTDTPEMVLAEKYERIIRRGIMATCARDLYDLHLLYRENNRQLRPDIFHTALEQIARARGSAAFLQKRREILRDMREEPQLYTLWRRYAAENPEAGDLPFHHVLDSVEAVSRLL